MEREIGEAERSILKGTLEKVVIGNLLAKYCEVGNAFSYSLPVHEPEFHVVGYERKDYLSVAIPNETSGGEFLLLVFTEFSGEPGKMRREISCFLLDMNREELENYRDLEVESLPDLVANLVFRFRKDEKNFEFTKFCRFGWAMNDGDLKPEFTTTAFDSAAKFDKFFWLAKQAEKATADGTIEKLFYNTKTEPNVVKAT